MRSICIRALAVLAFLLGFIWSAQQSAWAVEQHSILVVPTEGQDGYEGTLSFPSGFVNCYGQVSVAFGKQKFVPTRYHYRGKSYLPADFGMQSFKEKRPGAEISADVFRQDTRLGHAVFSNVIFFSIGCFAESYSVIRMIGLKDEDFRSALGELSLRNLTAKVRMTDSKIEGMIDEKLAEARKKEREAELAEKKKQLAEEKAQQEEKANTVAVSRSQSNAVVSAPSTGASASNTSEAEFQSRRNQAAQDTIRDTQAQISSDQVRVKAAGDTVSKIAEAAITNGAAFGAAFIFPSGEIPIGAPDMTSGLIGILFGNSNRPEDQTGEYHSTSGTEYMIAMNPDSLLATDPTERTIPIASGTPFKQWRFMCEAKFFGNIKRWKNIQPYLGVGGATYREYDSLLKYENGISPSASIGVVIVGHDSWFRMGYSVVLGGLEMGFAL